MNRNNNEYSDDDLRKIALTIAQKIHQLPNEHAFTIECDGTIFECKPGDDASVNVPLEKAKSARIIIHNHPHEFKEPSTFSGDDIFNLLYFRLTEIIVCSYGICYSMKNNGCTTLSSEIKNHLNKKYRSIEKEMRSRFLNNSSLEESDIRARYRLYKISIEREYEEYLTEYAVTKK